MSEILFLSHRIPYPPNKGDKIRSWHLLKGLSQRFTVHLGAFVDDPDDWAHVAAVREVCGETCFRRLRPSLAKLRSLRGFLSGDALTMTYYRDAELRRWIADLAARRRLEGVFAFSSSMAPMAGTVSLAPEGRRVIDFCDVDSDKWRQYSASHKGMVRWVYGREARLLEAEERRHAERFDVTLVSADAEARLLRAIAPAAAARIDVVQNGVDTQYFDPALGWPDPFPAGARTIVFTGAMDYYANVDGVTWFAETILPTIREQVPRVNFAIVGSNPTAQVRALANLPGVDVTGRVPDVRPYLAHADVVVAPLRLARGVQNKVLEAMAMGRRIVATSAAAQGLGEIPAGVLEVADSPKEMSGLLIAALHAAAPRSVLPDVRRLAMERFGWDSHVARVVRSLRVGPESLTARQSEGEK